MTDSSGITLHVDGYELHITHPGKIMFPETGITKMDLINYYLEMRSFIMFHNEGRPVVFVRYPHGLGSYSFFQKNLPPRAPEWMETLEAGKHKITRYFILNHIAGLIWLIQMGTLEFHVMGTRKPHLWHPDLMVFDLDPPEGASFSEIRDFALTFRSVIEEAGYRIYAKTSGKKGIHLVCPVKPQYETGQVLAAARDLAERMIARYPGATLDVRKEKRKGKFLIDIYRNRAFQTFSMPYGTRATPEAAVSMPLKWDELLRINDPHVFNLRTVPEWVNKHGDAWKDIYQHATGLHTYPGSENPEKTV
ncbi:MAG: DNA polymerase domain-containing protein [Chlorobi bacterium]|nr:DNA polymerase domain-containing protein [Chlorobiota bacterium]